MHAPLLMVMSSWQTPEIASARDVCHSGWRRVLPEMNCCGQGRAGWGGRRTEKTPKIGVLGSFGCQGSFHYGNSCFEFIILQSVGTESTLLQQEE